MRQTIKSVLRLAAVVAFAATVAPLAVGQHSQADRIDQIRREMREREARANEMRQRELDLLRLSEERHRAPVRRQGPRLDLAQIREDFMRIQVVNYNLAEAVSRGSELDLKFVAKSAAEIRKRAGRLKDNLALPEVEKVFEHPHAEVGPEPEHLKSSLSMLKGLIFEFVNNPIFRATSIVDVQLSAKARRDLEEIIEVSDEVKKASGRLNKIAQKR